MAELSFIVIAYNEQATIASCLASIQAQRDLPDEVEIIVIDDGSTDATPHIVAGIGASDPRVRLSRQENAGRGAARARGLVEASGDLIAFVDSDVVIPPHWWVTCRRALETADACGGIAVPDGDVALVHRLMGLAPRVRPHTIEVSGSNGLYRGEVFQAVTMDADRRNGEDVSFIRAMQAAGLRAVSLNDLVVEHRETKSYLTSCSWLYESGIGAARQYREHRQVRLPDVVLLGFIGVWVAAGAAASTGRLRPRGLFQVPAGYITVAAAAHLATKFELLRTPGRSIAAVALQAPLIACYLAGRVRGLLPRGAR